MSALMIDNLPEAVQTALILRAEAHGVSVEEEARQILISEADRQKKLAEHKTRILAMASALAGDQPQPPAEQIVRDMREERTSWLAQLS